MNRFCTCSLYAAGVVFNLAWTFCGRIECCHTQNVQASDVQIKLYPRLLQGAMSCMHADHVT